ncbi:cytochrome c oxidase subunit 7C, mitochondrial-like [Bombyx mandarina]|uniref:Cytochrome c oxidase subunit 7C, mitochondrial n=2 Tax=Bombyx TaxID=7090 RepID=A0A8R1WPD4_BOMMO|nr:cytochrome c oxidase subunit 7C, mitochondrial [Bombyx mori]XP_028028851.1 cytochrome c oxidase subunit 7C, mitochondrial-like [Bombyx mandarina]
MIGAVARISNRTVGKNVVKTSVRSGSNGGIPGENLPFDINNKARLTFHMFWFFGSGFAAPFLVVWHQMRKNSNS